MVVGRAGEMLKKIKIGKKIISENKPVFIIAEAGVNHNGSLNKAFLLIDEAVKAKANCIKFQTFTANELVLKKSPKAIYQLKNTNPKESQFEMLKKLELKKEDYFKLNNYCLKKKILFLSTPYNESDVDFLDKINVKAFKLASIHAAEPFFLKYVAKKNKAMILSTGMANLEEIDCAVKEIKKTINKKLILLQCTTNYPSSNLDANLLTIKTLSKRYNTIVGYSDHTLGFLTSILSIGLGAKVIEKHFTLDKNMRGPDHNNSLNTKEFKQFVKIIRESEDALGSGLKKPSLSEKKNIFGMRRSLVSKRDIFKGEKFNESMVCLKRPMSGIQPKFILKLKGKKIIKDIPSNSTIKWHHLKK